MRLPLDGPGAGTSSSISTGTRGSCRRVDGGTEAPLRWVVGGAGRDPEPPLVAGGAVEGVPSWGGRRLAPPALAVRPW